MLGVVDFALRRSRNYATVLIDAETGRSVDALPVALLTSTRRGHAVIPGEQIVCRDCSAPPVRRPSPAANCAVKADDRWHLWYGVAQAVRSGNEFVRPTAASCWAGQSRCCARQARRKHPAARRRSTSCSVRAPACWMAPPLSLSQNTVKHYDRAEQPDRLQRTSQYLSTLVDSYCDHLRNARRGPRSPGPEVAAGDR